MDRMASAARCVCGLADMETYGTIDAAFLRTIEWRDRKGRHGVIYHFLQRLAALLFCVLLSPLFLFLALAIKIDSKGPILFRQRRIGQYNREFMILKFRSMRTDTPDVATHLLQDPNQYITRVGRVLRKTSLDELPQLFNIVGGSMVFVGPRPALYNQYDLIEMRKQAGVDRLKPGITGWAQVNGRDELPLDVKVSYDRVYLEKRSFWFDCKIMWMTIGKVFRHEGVHEGA